MNWKAPFRPLVAFNTMLERRGGGLKLLRQMLFRSTGMRVFALPRSDVDYLAEVKDGTGSSVVTAPLYWMARTFPEAPPALWRKLDDGQKEQLRRHPLLELLEFPNPYCTGENLWMATIIDYMVDGNAYWLKLRNGAGRVSELWWTPSWMMRPVGDRTTFITHYEYTAGVDRISIAPTDVVHFKFGMDSEEPRLGKAPLKSVLREVFTDDEASAFTASLLRNMGVPGLIVSPAPGVVIEDNQAEETKASLMARFTGDRRGEPIVMTGATQIAQFGFSPEQLLLRELRRIPEERVTAVMGVPAIVAGLGAGLDRSTFTNMAEAREAAYESGIIPMQRHLAAEIRRQLLTEYESDPMAFRFGFDLAEVRVLQEDLSRQAMRWDVMVRGAWAMRSEARRAMGLSVDPERDDVFLAQANQTMLRDDEIIPLNGNGALEALNA